jgi:hypothetical protein
MRKIKEAITDFATARGYDGDNPKSIARAIDTLAGVSSSGGGGGGSNVVVVPWEENASDMTITLGMTVSEITEALRAGKVVVIDLDESTLTNGVHHITGVICTNNEEPYYEISISTIPISFYASGLNGYPVANFDM